MNIVAWRLCKQLLRGKYFKASVTFDDALVQDLDVRLLPKNWRDEVPPPELMEIGDRWILSRSSAILKVPSVIVPSEFNYLINPNHPNAPRTDQITAFTPYSFDPRLTR